MASTTGSSTDAEMCKILLRWWDRGLTLDDILKECRKHPEYRDRLDKIITIKQCIIIAKWLSPNLLQHLRFGRGRNGKASCLGRVAAFILCRIDPESGLQEELYNKMCRLPNGTGKASFLYEQLDTPNVKLHSTRNSRRLSKDRRRVTTTRTASCTSSPTPPTAVPRIQRERETLPAPVLNQTCNRSEVVTARPPNNRAYNTTSVVTARPPNNQVYNTTPVVTARPPNNQVHNTTPVVTARPPNNQVYDVTHVVTARPRSFSSLLDSSGNIPMHITNTTAYLSFAAAAQNESIIDIMMSVWKIEGMRIIQPKVLPAVSQQDIGTHAYVTNVMNKHGLDMAALFKKVRLLNSILTSRVDTTK